MRGDIVSAQVGKESVMRNYINFGTVAEMLGTLSRDPMKFFRTSQVIGFENNRRLYGPAYVLDFDKATDKGDTQFNGDLVFVHKAIITKAEKGGVNGFITTTGRIDEEIVNGIFASINSKLCEFPADGHLRYKFSAPANTTMTAYYYEDGRTKMVSTSDAQNITRAPVLDLQNLRHPDGTQTLHGLVGNQVYFCSVSRGTITNGSQFKWTKGNEALCMLSLPGLKNGEANLMIGTEKGILFGQGRISGTEMFRIETITVDSEGNRVYFKTGDTVYAIDMKDKFTRPLGNPYKVCDVPQGFPWMLTGPAVYTNNNQGMLFTAWEKTPEKVFNHSYRTVPLNIVQNTIPNV